MFTTKRSLGLAFTLTMLTSLVAAQVTTNAQRPQNVTETLVPQQVLSSRKIFIANAPGDIATTSLKRMYDDDTLPYSEFYTGMRNWGQFVLVPVPSEADLVFSFSYKTFSQNPEFTLQVVILDPKTQVPLWWVAESAGGSGSKNTRQRDLQKGVDRVIADIKRLYAASTPQNASQ